MDGIVHQRMVVRTALVAKYAHDAPVQRLLIKKNKMRGRQERPKTKERPP